MTARVIVLGGSGMLGSMVTDALARDPQIAVTATVRRPSLLERCASQVPEVSWRLFDAETDVSSQLDSLLTAQDWLVNAIGITKPLIRDGNADEVERAIRVNSHFPFVLARAAANAGVRVLQIATDCVYSGQRGAYREEDAHDPLDAYGKTKSLGEVPAANVTHLRCSIVGPEPKDFKFLQEWLLRQPVGAAVNGFVNHRWNGLTTLHFARICAGIIHHGGEPPRFHHVTPTGQVTKRELLDAYCQAYDRSDLQVLPVEARSVVDRTLVTQHPDRNLQLWRWAGYDLPPSVAEMVSELSQFDYRGNLTETSGEGKSETSVQGVGR